VRESARGGTGRATSTRCGHGTQTSAVGTNDRSHAGTENGANALPGSLATAFSYCARRVASAGAVSSHGNEPSAQNVAKKSPAEKNRGSPESTKIGKSVSAAIRSSGRWSPRSSARAAALTSE
jgi:hypothetical protein